MDMLEKVELVREKTGVTYQEAKEALEACDYDVLDAIIWLENAGKADAQTATYETKGTTTAREVSAEMQEAQEEYERTSKRTKIGEVWGSFRTQAVRLLRAGLDMTFIAERHGERVVAIPLLLVIIGILAWGASIWLLIIGLFFNFRYRIEGAGPVTIDVNDAMNKAADAAENFKGDFKKSE